LAALQFSGKLMNNNVRFRALYMECKAFDFNHSTITDVLINNNFIFGCWTSILFFWGEGGICLHVCLLFFLFDIYINIHQKCLRYTDY